MGFCKFEIKAYYSRNSDVKVPGSAVLAFHKNYKTPELFQQKFRIEYSRASPVPRALLFTIAACVRRLQINSMSLS